MIHKKPWPWEYTWALCEERMMGAEEMAWDWSWVDCARCLAALAAVGVEVKR